MYDEYSIILRVKKSLDVDVEEHEQKILPKKDVKLDTIVCPLGMMMTLMQQKEFVEIEVYLKRVGKEDVNMMLLGSFKLDELTLHGDYSGHGHGHGHGGLVTIRESKSDNELLKMEAEYIRKRVGETRNKSEMEWKLDSVLLHFIGSQLDVACDGVVAKALIHVSLQYENQLLKEKKTQLLKDIDKEMAEEQRIKMQLLEVKANLGMLRKEMGVIDKELIVSEKRMHDQCSLIVM